MPELPEVETIKCGLKKMIVARKITALEVLNAKSFDDSGYDIKTQLLAPASSPSGAGLSC
jgi:formamidopyrimidine-DNA glycosylase